MGRFQYLQSADTADATFSVPTVSKQTLQMRRFETLNLLGEPLLSLYLFLLRAHRLRVERHLFDLANVTSLERRLALLVRIVFLLSSLPLPAALLLVNFCGRK